MTTKPKQKNGRASGRRSGNLAIQVADSLRDVILRGDYADGDALRELVLCRKFGTSRIPVREALHRLEAEGLVTIRPNRGACVARISEAELIEIAEACRLLEGHILRLACPLLTPEVLDQAEKHLAELDRLDDPREWSRQNWRFHTTLYAAAQRPLLVDWLASLRVRAERAMLMLVAERKRRLALNREHRAILACLRAKDASKAARLLDAHLLGGQDTVLRLIEPR